MTFWKRVLAIALGIALMGSRRARGAAVAFLAVLLLMYAYLNNINLYQMFENFLNKIIC